LDRFLQMIDLRNKMTHRNSPNVVAMNDFDMTIDLAVKIL